MNRRNERGMGYEYEKQKRERDQKNKITINLDRKCVECKKIILAGTMSSEQREFSRENGVHCKECMDKKTRKYKPWLRDE